jgi:hypothetical protein
MHLEDPVSLASLHAYKLIEPGLIEARHSVDHAKTNLAAVALLEDTVCWSRVGAGT